MTRQTRSTFRPRNSLDTTPVQEHNDDGRFAGNDWASKPEWAIFNSYGRKDKTYQAIASLAFMGEEGGFYHYVDTHTGEEFSAKTQEKRNVESAVIDNYDERLKEAATYDFEVVSPVLSRKTSNHILFGILTFSSLLFSIGGLVNSNAILFGLCFAAFALSVYCWFRRNERFADQLATVRKNHNLPERPVFPDEKTFYSSVELDEFAAARQAQREAVQDHQYQVQRNLQVAQTVLLADLAYGQHKDRKAAEAAQNKANGLF